MEALKASKPSKLILIKAMSKGYPLGEMWREKKKRVGWRKHFSRRKKQVAIVMVSIVLSIFTLIYKS